MKVYLYCQACNEVTPAEKWSLGSKVCRKCGKGAFLRTKRVCEICGSELYAPKDLLAQLTFPCHPEALEEKPIAAEETRSTEENAGNQAAQATETTLMTCVCCGSRFTLHVQNGEVARCPQCGAIPDLGTVVSRMARYTSDDADIIEWRNDEAHYIIHRDPRGQNVKKYSLLVVNEGQRAVFQCGGHNILREPGVYAIARDDRSRRDIIQAVNEGQTMSMLSLKFNTDITFFDDRRMNCRYLLKMEMGNGLWEAELPFDFTYGFDYSNADCFLNCGLTRTSDAAANQALHEKLDAILSNRIFSTLRRLSSHPALAALQSADSVKHWLLDMIDENTVSDIQVDINDDLLNQYGLMVENLRLYTPEVQVSRQSEFVKVKCVLCGREESVRRSQCGDRVSYLCESCRYEKRFCKHCNAYVLVERGKDICNRCGQKVD